MLQKFSNGYMYAESHTTIYIFLSAYRILRDSLFVLFYTKDTVSQWVAVGAIFLYPSIKSVPGTFQWLSRKQEI